MQFLEKSFLGACVSGIVIKRRYASNPLLTFPRNFPVNGEGAKLPTCYGLATGKLV